MSTRIEHEHGKTENIWRISGGDRPGFEESAAIVICQPHDKNQLPHPVTTLVCTQDLGGLVSAHAVTDVASILLVALAADFDHIRFVLKSLLEIGKVSEITGASSFLEN